MNHHSETLDSLLVMHDGKKACKLCGSELLLCHTGSARIQLQNLQLHVCYGVPVSD